MFKEERKSLQFDWSHVGDIEWGRPNLGTHHFMLTVAEDLDCSGLPITDESVCTFDEGFIAALFSTHFGRQFTARETDCWCTGDRVCRFEVMPVDA